ncbi:GNAT family N-acetyltransferase [uncultured Sneathiella sp.]|uniref:GNAT family N-acetyltransferase n=1 Tax=uncultured Sneathiella sp. TaxID=879315 RepID=UPI0030EEA8C1|tara:strand:- start:34358 stop:34816 length:459 start_codon:yes stop_codon:yes gene_type:complete
MQESDISADFFDTASAAPLAAAIHGQCFKSGWSEKDFVSAFGIPGTVLEVLSLTDQPVAIALYRQVVDEAEILTLGTMPAYREKGLAGQLLERGFHYLRRNKVAFLYLEVGVENIPAQRLYTSKGFIETGQRPNYYNHGAAYEDALMMKRSL